MGIFSFLSRKSHDKKAAALKAHAYDTISAGTVPVQGAYPVSGNGPNVFDMLSRGGPDLRHTQLSLMVPSNDNGAAPAPGVPRYRDPSRERPSTAPNGRPPSLQHMSSGTKLRKAGKKAPPVSFKMLRSTGSIINGNSSRPGSQGSEFDSKSISRGAANHSRSNSMRSESGRFKDILDAHSELKPPDFRARVKAAGAKDYGEDVAERNMGENGFELESEHVKAFYDSHPNAARARKSVSALSSRSSRHTIRETPHREPQPKWPMAPPPPSIAPSQRSLPKALAGQIPRYKSTETALYADMKTTGGGHLKRRVSVNTYMPPTASYNNTSAVSLSKVHGSEINTIDLDIMKPPITMSAPRSNKKSPRTARIPRDSVMLTRRKVSVPDHPVGHHRDSSPERTFSLRSAATQPHHHHHHRASMSSVFPRKRHSLHTLCSSVSSSVHSREMGFQGVTPLAYPRPHTAYSLQRPAIDNDDPDCVDSFESSPSHKTPSTILKDETVEVRPVSRGFLPLGPRPATAVPFEIPEHHFPIRTRSLRGNSASSGTLTTARSSSPGGRPQSRQTAATTVTSSPRLSVKPAAATPLSPPPTPRSDNFNMDDYLSSDDDSIAGGGGLKRPTGEGEEGLLWKEEGYGGGGLQLPGLWEVFPDATATAKGDERRDSEMVYTTMGGGGGGVKGLKTNYSYNGIGDSFGPGRGRYVLDTAAHYQSTTEEEGGDGGGESEGGAKGRQMAIRRGRRRRLEGIYQMEGEDEGDEADDEDGTLRVMQGSRHQSGSRGRASVASYYEELKAKLGVDVDVIEEEREVERVDVATAVRLRKQIKKEQRLAGKNRTGGIRLRRGREEAENGAANIGVRRRKSVPVLCVGGKEFCG